MDNVTHTPGPWVVNEDGNRVESEREHGWANDGWIICKPDGPDASANARLISAAPDLLKWLYQYRSDMLHPPSADSRQRRVQAIDKVIAKATGTDTTET